MVMYLIVAFEHRSSWLANLPPARSENLEKKQLKVEDGNRVFG